MEVPALWSASEQNTRLLRFFEKSNQIIFIVNLLLPELYDFLTKKELFLLKHALMLSTSSGYGYCIWLSFISGCEWITPSQ